MAKSVKKETRAEMITREMAPRSYSNGGTIPGDGPAKKKAPMVVTKDPYSEQTEKKDSTIYKTNNNEYNRLKSIQEYSGYSNKTTPETPLMVSAKTRRDEAAMRIKYGKALKSKLTGTTPTN